MVGSLPENVAVNKYFGINDSVELSHFRFFRSEQLLLTDSYLPLKRIFSF